MQTSAATVGDIITEDEPGFACSKTRLVEAGLIHFRPFNISLGGVLLLHELYQVPPGDAPAGRAKLEAGDILFNNTNSAELVGKSALVTKTMVAGFSNHLNRIRVDPSKVDPRWFAFWLRKKREAGFFSHNATRWVSQAAYKTSELRKLPIQLPSLSEQQRVADVLSQAENIVRMRRKAKQKAKEIIPALFLNMFGDRDPGRQEANSVVRLGDVAEVVSGVAKGRKLVGKVTREVAYLRVANVQAGGLDLAQMKYIPATADEIAELAVRAGDILLTEGGDFDKVGRGALLEADIGECIHQNHVFRVRTHAHRVLPEYFAAYLQTSAARQYFLRAAKKTSNLASINMTQLRNLQLPLPRLETQREFQDRFRDCRALEQQQADATVIADTSFQSLLAMVLSEGQAK